MRNHCPTLITVKNKAIKNNVAIVKKLAPGCRLMAVVKANGYGHGMALVSEILAQVGVNKFGVATLAEAVMLRQNQKNAAIILLGGANWTSDISVLVENEITPSIGSTYELELVANWAIKNEPKSTVKIHLDLDTGMGRTGLQPQDLPDFTRLWRSIPTETLELEGICTHFACADFDDLNYTKKQIVKFWSALEYLRAEEINFSVIHLANSAAIMQGLSSGTPEFFAAFSNYDFWVRPGLMLYGESPLVDQKIGLQPALELSTQIVASKWLPPNSFVGYASTFQTKKSTLLAVVGAGYFDGIPLALSGNGYALISGVECPIIGRVSMNLMAIDVTAAAQQLGQAAVVIGAKVILLGTSKQRRISVADWARACHTIPYQIFTSLNPVLPRQVV